MSIYSNFKKARTNQRKSINSKISEAMNGINPRTLI
jgi:hypothetical protein